MPSVNLVRTFDGQLDRCGVVMVRFSPDGKFLAVGAASRLNLWDVGTGKFIRVFASSFRSQEVRDFAFSPDGTRIAAVGPDFQLAVWQVSDGRLLMSEGKANPAKDSGAYSIAYAPDGKHFAVGWTGGIRFWTSGTGNPEVAGDTKSYLSFYQLAFSPDGARLLAATSENLYHFPAGPAVSGVAQRRQ
jgi:WD40 repeat protein